MKLTNLVEIKNYPAGKGGNMLVALDEELCVNREYSYKGKTRKVQAMICTAYCANSDATSELQKHVDSVSPYTAIIVVNAKFMKISNKKQLALLERENAMLSVADPESSIEAGVIGDMAAIEKYGRQANRALNKAHRFMRRSEKKAAKGLHKAYKKATKVAKNVANEPQLANIMQPEVEPAN